VPLLAFFPMKPEGAACEASQFDAGADPIRVLWLTKGLDLGGQEKLLELLARAHDRKRFSIECAYAAAGLDHQVPALEAAGVPCRCLAVPGRRWSWIRGLFSLLRQDRFDVVHVHSPLVAALARPMVALRPRRRRPVLITTSHLEWFGYHPLTRWANRLTARLDDVPIAVSPAVARSMSGRARDRAVVMLQGIDVADLRRRFVDGHEVEVAVAERAVDADTSTGDEVDVVICTVANLSPQKDYATLLHAARLVVARRPQVRFVAVGYDVDDYARQMRDLRDQLGLADRFEFTGVRDDAVAVMAAADVYVVASAFEAAPITAMEAAAIGVPIVATDVGIMGDVFTNDEDCLRVPVGDPAALADSLVRMVDDGELRHRLVKHASRLADERFDIARVIVELETLYADRTAQRAAASTAERTAERGARA
jgi:glycosyltransferase involved in cell wall biosynthesis